MRIEATYFDGFTERLLSWKLEINDGKAYLEANWFKNKSPLRAKFRFDEASFRSALPSLSGMAEEYRPPWEDLEDRYLVVVDGETTIRRHVYGAWMLAQEDPEIRRFLEVWQMLEARVLAHLPANLRA
jgi:hypothetical protein